MSTSGNLIKVESGSLTLGNVTIDGNDVIISDSGAVAAINMADGTVIMNDGQRLQIIKEPAVMDLQFIWPAVILK